MLIVSCAKLLESQQGPWLPLCDFNDIGEPLLHFIRINKTCCPSTSRAKTKRQDHLTLSLYSDRSNASHEAKRRWDRSRSIPTWLCMICLYRPYIKFTNYKHTHCRTRIAMTTVRELHTCSCLSSSHIVVLCRCLDGLKRTLSLCIATVSIKLVPLLMYTKCMQSYT